MSDKYMLISIYKSDIVSKDGTQRDVWHVFGHVSLGINDWIATCEDRSLAIDTCFRYGIPVLWGQGAKVDRVLEVLCGVKR